MPDKMNPEVLNPEVEPVEEVVESLNVFFNLPSIENLTEDVYLPRLNTTITVNAFSEAQQASYQKLSLGRDSRFDISKFGKMKITTVANHIVKPNFSDPKFLDRVYCQTAEEFILTKFLPGEISEIYSAITKLSGFDKDIDEEIEEAKNS